MVLSSLSATLRINASTKPGSAIDGTIATTVLTRQHALPASMWICFAVPTLANAFPNSRSAIESSIATTVPTSKTAVATREHSGVNRHETRPGIFARLVFCGIGCAIKEKIARRGKMNRPMLAVSRHSFTSLFGRVYFFNNCFVLLTGNATFQRQLQQTVNDTPAIDLGKFIFLEGRFLTMTSPLMAFIFSLLNRLPTEKTCRLQTFKVSWSDLNLDRQFWGPSFTFDYCTGHCARR